MPWSRLDDSWYDHPKLMALPGKLRNAGAGLRDRALSWSNRHMADGHVPNAVLRTLDCTPDLRASLIAVGLFADEGSGVYIHDYADFNETRAELLERRSKAAQAGKLGGLAKKRNATRGPSDDVAGASDPLQQSPSETPSNGLAVASDPLPPSPAHPATNARAQNARPGPSPVPNGRFLERVPTAVHRAGEIPADEVLG